MPVFAVLDTVSVKSDVPEPVMDAGLKLPVTPEGSPDEDNVTAESNPPVAVTVTTAYPLCPSLSEPEVGETEMVKPPVTGAVTVSVKVVVCVILPPVPDTVTVYDPVAVAAGTVNANDDVPEPVMEVGVKV